MAGEFVTGIVVEEKALEWVALRGGKGRAVSGRSGRLLLDAESPPADETPDESDERITARIKAECRLPKGIVSAAVPSEHVLLRVMDLPPVDDDELASMVELQADKVSPFPVENMVVSHEVLERDESRCRVLVAAARLDAIEDIGNRLGAAGIVPARVDAALLGWWRSLRDADAVSPGRHLVLLLANSVPEVIVLEDGVPVVFRSMGTGMDWDEPGIAEETAREVGYALMSLELEQGPAASCTVTVFYRGEEPAGLLGALGEECACKVEARPLADLPTAAEGVARRAAGGTTLDLTPVSWTSARMSRSFRRRMLAAAVLILLAWGLGVGGLFGMTVYEESKLASLQSTREEWRGPSLEVRSMRRRAYMIHRYMDRSDSALECLRETTSVQPRGVDLTSFSYRKGEGVKIRGNAVGVNEVYAFKSALDRSELFPETRLEGPSTMRGSSRQSFQMEMKLPGSTQ